MPPWLPTTSDGFGIFATEVINKSTKVSWSGELSGQSYNERVETIKSRLSESLESWSLDGIGSPIEAIADDPNKVSARAKGWLFKQGWIDIIRTS